MSGGDPLFRLDAASVRWGETTAVSDVDLEVCAGEAVALVGPSGAGKTSLLRLLNGTLRPVKGRTFFRGRDFSSLSSGELRRVRSRIGAVPQDLALVPELRVLQNVATGRVGRQGLVGTLRDLFHPSREDLRAIHALLERVGIAEKMYQRIASLSGGQKQRVALARALWQEPDALLADEPVSSVDPARARASLELLGEIGRERGLTLVTSLHQRELARELFPRLVGMRDGRIVFDRASTDVTEAEFAALYSLENGETRA